MNNVVPWLILVAVVAFALWRRTRRARRPEQRRSPAAARRGGPAFMSTATALVATREIRIRVRGRLFRVVTALMLIGVAAAIIIPAATKGGRSTSRVGVVGTLSAAERTAVTSDGAAANTTVDLVPERDVAAARSDLTAGHIRVAVVDSRQVLAKKTLAATDTSTTARLAHAIASSLGQQRAVRAANLTPTQVAALANAKPLPVAGVQPSRTKGSVQATAVVGVILLFIMLTQYNGWTLTGVMEEKSSRVVEVLLAAVRPVQLLAGKVLGIGLLVFAQAGLVVAFALAVAKAVGSSLLDGAGPLLVGSILLWLVLGYAFYSWVYAAIGSMAERQDQVQSLALPVTIPMIVGYIFALSTAGSGSPSTFFDVLAYLPPTSPFAMPILVGLSDVTWWQFSAAVLISVLSTIGVARVAAYIYRRAVLRTGRRVKLREVFGRTAS